MLSEKQMHLNLNPPTTPLLLHQLLDHRSSTIVLLLKPINNCLFPADWRRGSKPYVIIPRRRFTQRVTVIMLSEKQMLLKLNPPLATTPPTTLQPTTPLPHHQLLDHRP